MNTGGYVVIGASGGIGRAVCRILVDKGERVVGGVRDLERAGGDALLAGVSLHEVDAQSWESVDALMGTAQEQLGEISGVALCVGSILLKPAHLTTQAEFELTVSKNLSTAFAVVRSAAKRMMQAKAGSIVLVSSAAATHGFPNHEAIAAAKAGVIGLTLSASATYASYGVRVNCVAPGLTRTGLAGPILGNELALKASQSMHALGRIGEADEVARAIVWLLDSEQSWVTGVTLPVDGGLGRVFSKRR